MTFAEKLLFLMKLTATSNKQLALAIRVDPSLISLLRTARRQAPRNMAHTRAMAVYFAKKCEGSYQRVALSETMGGGLLPLQMETEQLAGVLFNWLTDSQNQTGRFLNPFERCSVADADRRAGETPPLDAAQRDEASIAAYYGNEGKRRAVDALLEQLFSMDEPGTVLLSSDESLDWLVEDVPYRVRLQEKMSALIQRGFRIRRIAAPIYSTEQAFDSLSRLLPLYLTGQVESYYYPRLRDGLYRRTLIVLPETAAVVSTSVGERPAGRATVLTRDRQMVGALTGEFQDLLSKCRPMTTTYSTAGNSEALLRCILAFEHDQGNRIQQSTTLSSITSPPELLRLAAGAAPAEEAAAIVDAFAKAQTLFRQSLETYEVIDIHSLAGADEVMAGRVPISAGYLQQRPPVCYTPETYALHLESILHHVEQYENYHAVLRARDEKTHALMVKEGRQALLLRPGTPLTVFAAARPDIAEACRAYLMRFAETPFSRAKQREDTIQKLRRAIAGLRRCGAPSA